MSTFKVGDRVRRIATSYDEHMQVGTIGTVTKANYDGTWISVDHYVRGKDEYPYMSLYFELVTPEEQAMQHKHMKIRVKNKEHSRLIQQTLISMGYFWDVSENTSSVRDYAEKFLFTSKHGCIGWDTDENYFIGSKAEEVELITTYSIKAIDPEIERKKLEKANLEAKVIELQKQLDEMKQKLESL